MKNKKDIGVHSLYALGLAITLLGAIFYLSCQQIGFGPLGIGFIVIGIGFIIVGMQESKRK